LSTQVIEKKREWKKPVATAASVVDLADFSKLELEVSLKEEGEHTDRCCPT
jgi:hypothetical protein